MLSKIVAFLFAPLFRPIVERLADEAVCTDAFRYHMATFLLEGKHAAWLADEVGRGVDREELAKSLAGSDEFLKAVLNRVSVTAVADALSAKVLDELDHKEIAYSTAQMIRASDVADHVDTDAIRDSVIEAIDIDDIAEKAAENIDLATLAGKIEGKSLAEHIDLSDLAGELDHGDICKHLDVSDLNLDYSEIVSNLDLSDLAGEIDKSDIAAYIEASDVANEIDTLSVAQNLSMSELADAMDYEKVAKHIDISHLDLKSDVENAVNDVLCNGEDMIDYATLAKALITQFAKAIAKANNVEVRSSNG